MIEIDIKIDTKGLADKLKNKADKVDSEINKFHNDLINIAHRWVQNKAPRKTGKLKQSIQKKKTGNTGVVWQEEGIANYGKWVIEGTGPHIIEPKTKKALFWNGAGFPVKRVHHPGTKPNDFFSKAMPQIESEVVRRVQVFGKWLEEL